MHVIAVFFYVAFGISLVYYGILNEAENQETADLLMHRDGTVSKGKFLYFSVEEEGNIRLKLLSDVGDADMYVAENDKLPTYESDKYDLYSATCGEDVIDIPKSFKRPIIIGVYSNSMYEKAKFRLLVERLKKNATTTYSDFLEAYRINLEPEKERNHRKDGRSNVKPTSGKKLEIKAFIFNLLEALISAL